MNPKSPTLWATCALVFFLTADFLEAKRNITYALNLDHDNDHAKLLRARIEQVERLKTEGNTLFKKFLYLRAVNNYAEALKVCLLASASTLLELISNRL